MLKYPNACVYLALCGLYWAAMFGLDKPMVAGLNAAAYGALAVLSRH